MNDLLTALNLAEPASKQDVDAAEAALGFIFPDDFKDFIYSNGAGEGFVGEHYIIFWKISELAHFNSAYQFPIDAPGFIAIATDGGGDAFAFDTRVAPPPIVEVPFIGMSHEDGLRVADSFTHFLQRMRDTPGPLF